MACGKTTLGKKVAWENGYIFVDLDEYIENNTQKSIPFIFQNVGENEFRTIERNCLNALIAEYTSSQVKVIIACGGGTPCFFDNHARMQEVGISIYLQENPSILAQRLLQLQSTRPLLQSLNETELHSFVDGLLRERAQFYTQAHKILFSPSAQALAEYLSVF